MGHKSTCVSLNVGQCFCKLGGQTVATQSENSNTPARTLCFSCGSICQNLFLSHMKSSSSKRYIYRRHLLSGCSCSYMSLENSRKFCSSSKCFAASIYACKEHLQGHLQPRNREYASQVFLQLDQICCMVGYCIADLHLDCSCMTASKCVSLKSGN